MRVLLIGSGGREHALAWRFLHDDPSLELIAAPGNPGIATLGECVPIAATDLDALLQLARERRVDLTVVGPEAPLALGIVDLFRAAGLPIFGPTRAAAEIETSKAFAKQLMLAADIPTARAEIHTAPAQAKAAARRFGTRVVVKASGLAAGKGVVVCETLEQADQAIDDMLEGNVFGAAGHEVLIEEFMEGEELSVFAITDGHSVTFLPGLQDHKRLLDADRGPNTGGMGAYTPVTPFHDVDDGAPDEHSWLSVLVPTIVLVIGPTLLAMRRQGRPFTGLLYAGMMIGADDCRVVEFNCRFGDPETQALMPVLTTPLLPLLADAARGTLNAIPLSLFEEHADAFAVPTRLAPLAGACVTTVLAAANYPDAPRVGDVIHLPEREAGIHVFHAGTAHDAQGRLVTAGGRVLAVSALGADVADAQRRSLAYAERIRFDGRQYRTDIGWREIARESHRRSAGTSGN